MQALVVRTAGGSFERAEMPRPTVGRREVLVRILASGVNPLDTKIRAGIAPHARQPFPAVLGMDLAGEVVETGADVSAFLVGERVYGLTGGVAGLQGSLADYASVDADLLAPSPRNLTARASAALPLAAITAWEGLVDRAQARQGQRVLVHGGAGGVGHVAVQLARSVGADVYATVRPDQAELTRAYGATPIDYFSESVAAYVDRCTGGDGFDVVYDTVGGATLDASFQAVRTDGGHVVSCLGWGTHSLAPLSFRAATYSGVFTLLPMLTGRGRAHHGHILRQVSKLVEAGAITPLLDEGRYTFDTALEAHHALEKRRHSGKVVIDLDRPMADRH